MLRIVSIIFCFATFFWSAQPGASMFPRPGGPHGSESRQRRMLGGDEVTAYDLPFTCSVHYTQEYFPVGSCSILTSKVVLTTLSTMDVEGTEETSYTWDLRDIKPGYNPAKGPHYFRVGLSIRNYQDLVVVAGKDHLLPSEVEKHRKGYQESRVDGTAIVDTHSQNWEDKNYDEGMKLPIAQNIGNDTEQDFEFFTYRFNFVFLTLRTTLKWTPYVLPIPMESKYSNDYKKLRDRMLGEQKFFNEQNINEYIHVLAPGQYCVVGGWARRDDRPLTFKEVTMVTRKFCSTSYCNYRPISCLEYPRDEDLCYTSTAYGDVCDFDQGGALFCSHHDDSVVGFVKKSVDCGLSSIPVVYTPSWLILKVFFQIYPKQNWDKRPNWDSYRLIPTSTIYPF